jgi:hypothetical protein
MVIDVRKRGVGVFPPHRDRIEGALQELKNSGLPMEKVSVITQNADAKDNIAGTQVQEKVGDKAEEGAKVGAVSGGVFGGLTGLLVGLGTLVIPGVGPVMLAGAVATTLATTLAGAGIGAVTGGLIGGLIGLGIPEEEARVYNDRVQRGDYLVIVDGTGEEVAKTQAILQRWGVEEFRIYDHPNGKTSKYAIGYFSLSQDAQAAIKDLQNAGFALDQISLIHRGTSPESPRDRIDSTQLGLPDDRDRFYNERVNQGDYVIIVSGTDDQIQRAASILQRHGIQQWQVYDKIPPRTTKRAIGVFSHPRDREVAIRELGNAGFPMNQVSLIAKDATDAEVPDSLLVGRGITGGAADFTHLGIPEERARVYGDRFQRGDYLLIVDGTEAEIKHAEAILKGLGIEEFAIYDLRPGFDRVPPQKTPLANTMRPAEAAVTIIARREETL